MITNRQLWSALLFIAACSAAMLYYGLKYGECSCVGDRILNDKEAGYDQAAYDESEDSA